MSAAFKALVIHDAKDLRIEDREVTQPGAGQVRSRLAAGGRLVTNAVTLEAEASTITRHTAHGGRLTRIALEFADAIGGFTIMRPAQPVLQWRWVA